MTEQPDEHVTYDDDKAINPNHYQGRGGKQCYDVIKDILGVNTLIYFYRANVIKYLYRFDTKNGLQDIRKANGILPNMLSFIKRVLELHHPHISLTTRYLLIQY